MPDDDDDEDDETFPVDVAARAPPREYPDVARRFDKLLEPRFGTGAPGCAKILSSPPSLGFIGKKEVLVGKAMLPQI